MILLLVDFTISLSTSSTLRITTILKIIPDIPIQNNAQMNWKKQLGQLGEDKAVLFLQKKGMQILETNWRYQQKELDIIAMDGKILVFVEVKTRSDNNFGEPEAAVDSKKEAFMASAGAAYMRKISHEWEIRFDVVSIIYKNEQNFDLKYFEDAFFPQWKF